MTRFLCSFDYLLKFEIEGFLLNFKLIIFISMIMCLFVLLICFDLLIVVLFGFNVMNDYVIMNARFIHPFAL